MPVLVCPDCHKRYRLTGGGGTKMPRCRQCDAELIPSSDEPDLPLRQVLKLELARLATVQSPPDSDAEVGPRLRVAEHTPPAYGRWLLWGLLALVLVAGAGGGWWAYRRAHRPAPELPREVKAAMAKAGRSEAAGAVEGALADWQSVRGMILAYRFDAKSPDAFGEEMRSAEDHIGRLQGVVRRRRAALPQMEQTLTDARLAVEAGRRTQARKLLERMLGGLDDSGLPASDRARLRRAAEEMLADPRLGRAPESRRAGAGPGKGVVMIDAPGSRLRWRSESWANPATLAVEGAAGGGPRSLVVRQQDGGTGKWALSLDQALDVRGYASLALEVSAAGPVDVALGLWTGPAMVLHETRPQKAGKGTLSFGLTGKGFKSQATNWKFSTSLKNPETVRRITLFIYGRARGPIRIRNVRLVKGQ